MVTEQNVRDAFFKASEGRKKKAAVVEFENNLNNNCKLIADIINSGKTGEYLKYIQLKRKNTNGKWRDIDAPTFFTLVMQHVWIMLVKPLYMAKETGIARNCIEGRGICSEDIDKGLLRPMLRLFYDMRQYSHLVCIDERKCYEHTTVKAYRKGMKAIGARRELIDFGESVGFVRGILPIGTPTSPLMHHIAVYPFDVWLNGNYPHALRYADNVFVPVLSLEEGHQVMWRIKMNWWYELCVRSKSTEQRVVAINDKPVDICGFRICRFKPRKDNHGKGLTRIRKSIWHNAIHAETKESWASYFGILSHADCYRSLVKKCKEMKLEELTSRCKLKRTMDAIEYDPREVLEIGSFDIIDYEILKDKKTHEDNWINLFCGRKRDGTNKLKAFAFHGNMKCIYMWIRMLEEEFGGKSFLPIEDVRLIKRRGYLLDGTAEIIEEIDPDEYYRNQQTENDKDI
ncbi:MAG: hypothetical protein MR924_13580 [Prevotella sp.]|nr:hypothetical protein [Prevotella sp.]